MDKEQLKILRDDYLRSTETYAEEHIISDEILNNNIFYSTKTLNEGNLSDKFREELTEYWEILNLIKSERTIQNSKKR